MLLKFISKILAKKYCYYDLQVGEFIDNETDELNFSNLWNVFIVEGCSDPDLPDNMWMKRLSHEALVGCKSGVQTTWLLKCIKGVWEGQVGICSSLSGSASIPAHSKNKGTLTHRVATLNY